MDKVGCEDDEGLLIVHDEDETCAVCAPKEQAMTKMALVPAMVTEAMYEAVESPGSIQQSWERMLAASRASGRVSRADLERAARAIWMQGANPSYGEWDEADMDVKNFCRADARAAFEAIGLSLEPGIQDEGGV